MDERLVVLNRAKHATYMREWRRRTTSQTPDEKRAKHRAIADEWERRHGRSRGRPISQWRVARGSLANRIKSFRHRVKVRGLTGAEYDAIFERQGGRCAICRVEANLVLDHNHATGRVRGLLCDNCNKAIGILRDDASLLERAITYLRASE